MASETANCICSSKSSAFSTIRIPLPPPPAAALIKIGKPTSMALFFASLTSEIASSVPGTIGIWYFKAAAFADNLLPIISIASGDGPIKIKPAALTLLANSAFSDKKP